MTTRRSHASKPSTTSRGSSASQAKRSSAKPLSRPTSGRGGVSGATSDAELTRRVAARDRAAFDVLWKRYEPTLNAAARAMLRGGTPLGIGPEDLLQDTASEAWTSIDQYTAGPGFAFRGWLVGIMRNRFRRIFDLKDMRRGVQSGIEPGEDAIPRRGGGGGGAASPSSQARRREVVSSFLHAIGGAPSGATQPTRPAIALTDQDLLVLRLLDNGLALNKIGEQVGMPSGQIYEHIQGIYKKLDNRLGGLGRHAIPGFTSAESDVPESRVGRIKAARKRRDAEARIRRAKKSSAKKAAKKASTKRTAANGGVAKKKAKGKGR